MKACVEQRVVERVEDGGDKEKKKTRRRSNRRSKQNNSLSASSSANENRQERSVSPEESVTSCKDTLSQQCGLESPSLGQLELDAESDIAFSSMPVLHLGENVDVEVQRIQNIIACDNGGGVSFKSFPEVVASRGLSEACTSKGLLDQHQKGHCGGIRPFAKHWSAEAVCKALEKGEVFKAEIRVNGYNPLEAYCKVDGVPIDILINGFAMQNRAVLGDIVAIKIEPFPMWAKMKGSTRSSGNSEPAGGGSSSGEVNDEVSALSCKDKSIVAEGGSSCDRNMSCVDTSSTSTTHLQQSSQEANRFCNGHESASGSHQMGPSSGNSETDDAIGKICSMIISNPLKRPTGRVVSIVERSPRRDTIVGFLNAKAWLEVRKKHGKKKAEHIPLIVLPKDARFPKMMVYFSELPDSIQERLSHYDVTVESELVAARIDDWNEENDLPYAHVVCTFGGGELQNHIDAILYEHCVCDSEFSEESLLCLPSVPWEVPEVEYQSRKDLRNLCVFTIDPSTATDLDDALSVEEISTGLYRVGVHIADVSYFVQPNTPLDTEAQGRSTSVYMSRSKLPMLPPLLSEDLGSLNPGVEKLTFSIFWDVDNSGSVVDRWIGRTIIQSCCKLSYELAQDMIDGVETFVSEDDLPQLYGPFEWYNVIRSVKNLDKISKLLKAVRFRDGALQLESSKVNFLFDVDGIPYDSVLSQRRDSNFLVEEFMLLANRTAAEVISRAFPDTALLRRHPAPESRKLMDFEAFCFKYGLDLDTSSSAKLQISLERAREVLKDDPVLVEILMSYAARPMQLATYFCTGDFEDAASNWGHYALAVPFYTHFTSPLRRYPDIVVHRMLVAALEAEDSYIKKWPSEGKVVKRCFSGIYFDKSAAASQDAREAFSAAALKHGVPSRPILTGIASHCNERKLTSRKVKDECDKLYLWVLLEKKGILLSEARVLALGPKFMSVYIPKIAMELRIHYDEIEGLYVEWLSATSTLVLSHRFSSVNRGGRCRQNNNNSKFRPLEEFSLLANPVDEEDEEEEDGSSDESSIHPLVFPVTVRVLSTIPVALHAFGGHDGPIGVCARLYTTSYFGPQYSSKEKKLH